MKYMEFMLHTCYVLILNLIAASQKSPRVRLCGAKRTELVGCKMAATHTSRIATRITVFIAWLGLRRTRAYHPPRMLH